MMEQIAPPAAESIHRARILRLETELALAKAKAAATEERLLRLTVKLRAELPGLTTAATVRDAILKALQ